MSDLKRDLVIIGAGPAGLSAAVYAKRAGLDALLIDEMPVDGGQVLSTYEVDNYLGLPGVSGMELSDKFSEHAKNAGIERMSALIKKIEGSEGDFTLISSEGDIKAKRIIIATGAKHALLNAPGEEELSGMGVSYCATCDGAFYRKKDVAVVGGSDVAVEDAIYLARTSNKVYLIHRRDTLRAAHSLVEALKACPNVEFVWDSTVKSINGTNGVESVSVINKVSGEERTIEVRGVFIAVGITPVSYLLKEFGVDLDDAGYVIAGEDCRSSVNGIYVAGDIRKKPLRQIITAVADGANAVSSVQADMNK
ncbi:MAG: FAD-dependent oxidoreductase [Lachnospiraceae bacterium]|nr:FAD-dependent oxidoreductase [Lachnospiraceae bacterium]